MLSIPIDLQSMLHPTHLQSMLHPTHLQSMLLMRHCWAQHNNLELAVTVRSDSEVNFNAETCQSLQARHQALQANLAEQAVSSKAIQQHLEQQLAKCEEELQVCIALMLPLLQ